MNYKRVEHILLKPANAADVIAWANQLAARRNVHVHKLVADILRQTLPAKLKRYKA